VVLEHLGDAVRERPVIGEHPSIFDRIEARERRTRARRDALLTPFLLVLGGILVVVALDQAASAVIAMHASHRTPLDGIRPSASRTLANLLNLAGWAAYFGALAMQAIGGGRRWVKPIGIGFRILSLACFVGAAFLFGSLVWTAVAAAVILALIFAAQRLSRRWAKRGTSRLA
jgi:hypothetical protein